MSHSAAERLQAIRAQLQAAPRTNKLSGQVCIVTGGGSVAGIGAATCKLFAHEGAKHIYALDYVGDGLVKLEEFMKKNYPDVKVSCVWFNPLFSGELPKRYFTDYYCYS